MRQETNNEIDLLLRRMSRGQGATAPDGDLRDHLDADELSSYAENALPAAARARYTDHLAECSRCRELVVQLSSAAGVVLAEEPSRVSEPSGLRKFLASLFSPMVLRYAVPAMGLIVVAVIGFTVFRQGPGNRSPRMAATDRATNAPAVAQETKPQAGFIEKQEKSGSLSPTPEPRRQRNEAEPPAPMATPAANTPADAIKEEPTTKTDSQTVATAAPPPAAPKPAEVTDEARKREPEAKKQEAAQGRAAATPQAERERDFQATAGAAPGVETTRRPANRGALTTAEAQGAGARTAQKLGEKAQKDRDDGETRSVAGRRFRRKGGVWVDTAYSDGETMNLTRGSERYRALVADEPEIKTIADQLDGQIIVVWKGRPYRIQ
jgi:hypothetical protein